MEVTVATSAGAVAIVQPIGRLDLLAAPDLKQLLTDTVASGHHHLVVDLSNVTFVDSSGLGALIGGLKAARLAGGDLRIARPNEQARLILELTTLDRVLRPYATLEEACAGY
jgi:anti-anti-sigma factor